MSNVKKKKGTAKDAGDELLEEENIESEEEDDSIERDAMIKVRIIYELYCLLICAVFLLELN